MQALNWLFRSDWPSSARKLLTTKEGYRIRKRREGRNCPGADNHARNEKTSASRRLAGRGFSRSSFCQASRSGGDVHHRANEFGLGRYGQIGLVNPAAGI